MTDRLDEIEVRKAGGHIWGEDVDWLVAEVKELEEQLRIKLCPFCEGKMEFGDHTLSCPVSRAKLSEAVCHDLEQELAEAKAHKEEALADEAASRANAEHWLKDLDKAYTQLAEARKLCKEAAQQMDPGDVHGPNEEPCEWCDCIKRLRAFAEGT